MQDPPARAESRDALTRKERGATPPPEAATRHHSPPPDLLESEAAYAAPTRIARVRRWVRRTVIRTVAVAIVLGGGAYFARPYLPAKLVQPVEAWLRGLPRHLRSAPAGDQVPAPASERQEDDPKLR